MPRSCEGFDTFTLEPCGQGVIVNVFAVEFFDYGLGVTAVDRQHRSYLAVIGKG